MRPLTKDDVFAAADVIATSGETPTQEAVRAQCGNRGSYSTIARHLRAWRDLHDADKKIVEAHLSSGLQQQGLAWIAGVYEHLRAIFEKAAMETAADVRRREAESSHELDAACDEAEKLAVVCEQQRQDALAAKTVSARLVEQVATQHVVLADLKVQLREKDAIIAELSKALRSRRSRTVSKRVSKSKSCAATIAT